MDTFKYVQTQAMTLYGAGASIGDTSLRVVGFNDLNGTALTITDFGSKGFGTIEPGTTDQEEPITFTGVTNNGDGTSTLTGIKTQLGKAPYTETSGLAITHAGGTTFALSNTAGFYDALSGKGNDETVTGIWTFTAPNYPRMDSVVTAPTLDVQFATKKYADDLIAAGAPKATNTVYGISKLSVAAASAAAPIAVGDNDNRVSPVSLATVTAAEVAALVGTGTPNGTTGKYVTNDDTTGTGSILRSSLLTSYGDPFGDGSDGTVTWDGAATILGMAPAGNIYTLTRDIYINTGTVNNGVTIKTAGYKIFAKTLLTNNGTISRNGNNGGDASSGTAGTAGAALASGTLFGSVAGVVGATGQNIGSGAAAATAGTNGIAVTTGIGSVGTAGGLATGSTNAQTTAGTFTASVQGVRNLTFAITMTEFLAGTLAALKSSSGSGSGSAGGTNSAGQEGGGGGSGSSGGIVWISTKTLTNGGTISANGGNGGKGGDGTLGAFSGSGGGAGAGGVVVLITHTITLGTVTVNAGTPGAGGTGGAGAGGDAPAGNAGVIYNFAI